MLNKKILFVYGPTASGKTEFVDRLAQQVPIEVVNMDSAQFYVPFTVGTAKPDWKATPFEQHMFDCIDTPRAMTVREYYERVVPLVKSIQARGNLAVLVGGSGFYLKSLLFPIKIISQEVSPKNMIITGCANLWQELNEIDPDRARDLHQHDVYRITRALNIWHTTGIKPSLYKPEYNPIMPYTLVITCRHKEDLYKRINERVLVMLQTDWVKEVASLINTPWQDFIQQKGFIGYNDIIEYIKGQKQLDDVTTSIQQKTRQYARKQESFGRMLMREIDENILQYERQLHDEVVVLNLTSVDLGLYIKQLLHKLY